MITLYVSMGLFILMLLLPIALSFLMLGRSGDTTLPIAREQVKDPRFFAKSFARLFEARWAEDDFRSINGQIEYLLSECVKPAGGGQGYGISQAV